MTAAAVREAFREARDAAMRGERLVGEGDDVGAYASITAAIGALERANDRLEALEADGLASSSPTTQEAARERVDPP